PEDLPRAPTEAFSLDDIGTTEIDDAFSLQRSEAGALRVGVHIAAPALGFAPGSSLDRVARERLSTAYMPGRKFTMLPPEAIARLSLDQASERPVVSLYVDVDEASGAILARHTRLERMNVANSAWGELLAERDVAAIYRVQSIGKVRFSVHPEPHEGLGVSCYAWMSSPLRRYVDLVNQWQLVAACRGQRAPFARNSDALLAALRAFEVTYARYDEHQYAMETYWTLRWLQ